MSDIKFRGLGLVIRRLDIPRSPDARSLSAASRSDCANGAFQARIVYEPFQPGKHDNFSPCRKRSEKKKKKAVSALGILAAIRSGISQAWAIRIASNGPFSAVRRPKNAR